MIALRKAAPVPSARSALVMTTAADAPLPAVESAEALAATAQQLINRTMRTQFMELPIQSRDSGCCHSHTERTERGRCAEKWVRPDQRRDTVGQPGMRGPSPGTCPPYFPP